MTARPFRRAGVDHGTVFVETEKDELWYLPNAGAGYRPYDPAKVLRAVISAGFVNLEHWKRLARNASA